MKTKFITILLLFSYMLVLSHNIILHHHGDTVMFDDGQIEEAHYHHKHSDDTCKENDSEHDHDSDCQDGDHHHHQNDGIPCQMHNQNTDVYLAQIQIIKVLEQTQDKALQLLFSALQPELNTVQDINNTYFEESFLITTLYYPEAHELRGPPTV